MSNEHLPVVCLANDVGRVSWIENLHHEPAGDCHGDIYRILMTDAFVCERHLLQYHLGGRRFLARRLKEQPA